MGSQRVRHDCATNFLFLFIPYLAVYSLCCCLLFRFSAMSDSLQPRGVQYARLSCPTVSWRLLRLMSIELMMPSKHLIVCHPLLLLPSVFPSIRVFSSELALHIRWPECWSFSISPFNEYSGLISLRIDWLDLFAVQGTLKSLLQHHSSKASFLSVQVSVYSSTLTSIQDCWKKP